MTFFIHFHFTPYLWVEMRSDKEFTLVLIVWVIGKVHGFAVEVIGSCSPCNNPPILVNDIVSLTSQQIFNIFPTLRRFQGEI